MKFFNVDPDERLKPYIRRYSYIRGDGIMHYQQRVVPNGGMGLAFFRKRPAIYVDERGCNRTEHTVLQGIYDTFLDVETTGVEMIAADFEPFGARVFFALPIFELKGTGVTPQDIGDRELIELEERIMEAAGFQECTRLMNEFFLRRLSLMRYDAYNLRRMQHVVWESLTSDKMLTASAMAEAVCLSPRQFSRVFGEYIGFAPKGYLRIERFHRAMRELEQNSLLRGGASARETKAKDCSLTDIAWSCGYYDLSHMNAEFHQFAGCSPRDIIERMTILHELNNSFL